MSKNLARIVLITLSLISIFIIFMFNKEQKIFKDEFVCSIKFTATNVLSEEMLQKVTKPLESAIRTIPGIKSINSICSENSNVAIVKFYRASDEKSIKIRNIADNIYSQLDPNFRKPVVIDSDSRDFPSFIFSLNLQNNNTYYDKETKKEFNEYNITKNIQEEIKSEISSISGVTNIKIGNKDLKRYTINYNNELLRSEKISNRIFSDTIRENYDSVGVGFFESEENEFPIIIKKSNKKIEDLYLNTTTKISHISDVSYHKTNQESITKINGREDLIFYTYCNNSANKILISIKLKQKLKKYNLTTIYDSGNRELKELLYLLLSISITTISLFSIDYFINRALKNSIALITILPISLLISIAFAKIFGFKINSEMLTALNIGAGIVIDSGVVLLSVRKKEAIKSIIVSTSTSIIALFPLYSKIFSTEIHTMILTLTIFILVSSIIYTIFFPKFIKQKAIKQGYQIKRLKAKLFLQNISSPKTALMIFIILIPTIALLLYLTSNKDFDREKIENTINIEINPKPNIVKEEKIKDADKLYKLIKKSKHFKKIKYIETSATKNSAKLNIYLNSSKNKKAIQKEIEEISNRYKIPIIISKTQKEKRVILYFFKEKTENDSQKNIEELISIAKKSAKLLTQTGKFYKAILHYKPATKGYQIKIKERVNPKLRKKIITNFYANYQEPIIYKLQEEEKIYDVALKNSTKAPNTIEKIKLKFPELIIEDKKFYDIYRKNGRNTIQISLATKIKDNKKIEKLIQRTLPKNINYQHSENFKASIENRKKIPLLIIISLALIYLNLVIYYNSFLKAIIPISSLPITFIPSLLLIKITGQTITPAIIIGIIISLGININNLIITFDLNRPIEKINKHINCLTTTTLTTILGVLPLLLIPTQNNFITQIASHFALSNLTAYLFTILIYPTILNLFKIFFRENLKK